MTCEFGLTDLPFWAQQTFQHAKQQIIEALGTVGATLTQKRDKLTLRDKAGVCVTVEGLTKLCTDLTVPHEATLNSIDVVVIVQQITDRIAGLFQQFAPEQRFAPMSEIKVATPPKRHPSSGTYRG